jgi:hypothetical protein
MTTSRRSPRAHGRVEIVGVRPGGIRSESHWRSRSNPSRAFALGAVRTDRIAGGGEGESGKRRHRMSPVGQRRSIR